MCKGISFFASAYASLDDSSRAIKNPLIIIGLSGEVCFLGKSRDPYPAELG